MAGRQRLAAVAVVALLASGLSGCGGGADAPATPSGSPTPSTASPTAATPTGPAKPTDRSPHGVLLSAQLAMQTARRAKVSYRLGAEAGSGPLFWQPKTALQIKRVAPADAEQLIVVDTVAYQGGDAATAARQGGRHWERFTVPPDPDGHKEIPYAGLIDLLNPVEALAAATADGADPAFVGEEKYEDSTVEHYRVTITAEKYAAAQTQLTQARRDGLRAALAPGGSLSLTLDLWLNDKDQLVRLQRTGSGDSGRADDSVLYSDLAGALLSAQAPAEADTVDTGVRTVSPLAR
ncbi:hypothetical protein GCM10018790_27000 [Kitasatospora xanthocidica]|uniref:hypothetical protein n=1 Tax=Kitasatospora xanthocidica TaxID=83382 RepID=UPI001671ECFE|nr:hypothetical protein [Kitasatospora xanthocidica]GHF47912.1 hypothetical protein GCM10018790_27000 [Kitasatospora xanthocidica]